MFTLTTILHSVTLYHYYKNLRRCCPFVDLDVGTLPYYWKALIFVIVQHCRLDRKLCGTCLHDKVIFVLRLLSSKLILMPVL